MRQNPTRRPPRPLTTLELSDSARYSAAENSVTLRVRHSRPSPPKPPKPSSAPNRGYVAAVVGVAGLAVAALLGALFAFRLGGRWAIAVAMAWAMGWIAVGRLAAPPLSTVTAVAAILAGLAILAVTGYVASRRLSQRAGTRHR